MLFTVMFSLIEDSLQPINPRLSRISMHSDVTTATTGSEPNSRIASWASFSSGDLSTVCGMTSLDTSSLLSGLSLGDTPQASTGCVEAASPLKVREN